LTVTDLLQATNAELHKYFRHRHPHTRTALSCKTYTTKVNLTMCRKVRLNRHRTTLSGWLQVK